MENRKTRKVPAAESVLVTRPNLKLLVIVLFVAVFGVGLFASSAFAGKGSGNLASSSIYINIRASNSDGGWTQPLQTSSSSSVSVTKYTTVKVSWTAWSSLWQRLIGHFKRDLTPSENDTTNNQSTSTQSTGASSQ